MVPYEPNRSSLGSLVDVLPFGLLAFDDDGIIREINGTLLSWLGEQRNEVVGRHVDRLLPPGGKIFYQTHLFPLLRSSGTVSELYVSLRHRSGEALPVLLNARRVDQGESLINLAAFVVINNRQQFEGALIEAVHAEQAAKEELARASRELDELNAALTQSNAVKDEFIGLVSHELRTPISTVLTNAGLLLQYGDLLPEEERRQSLADIASEGRRLEGIIENLLLLARLDNSSALELETVDLAALLANRIEDFMSRRPDREVAFAPAGTEWQVRVQPGLLTLVIDNLLSNADKYSPPAGAIQVRLRRVDDQRLEVHCKDQGIGLKEEDLSGLFTPFRRTQAAKSYASGMGLGLAVSKRIIDAHGGRIWAATAPEGGAVFSFSLPLQP